MVGGLLSRLAKSVQGIPPLRLAVAGGVAAVVAIGLFAGAVALRGDGPESGVQAIDAAELDLEGLAISVDGVLDSDLDGLVDALESVVHGSDPQEWNTTGTGIPDGWLAEHGLSPTDRGVAQRPAAVPSASDLPPAYGNRWPSRFTPTILDVYMHGRPAGWDEATQGPFRNGLDPREWDANGDGIPDGWLLHHGLDPLDGSLPDQRLAGPTGLTVREAFERATDPTSLDSDGDGLRDTEEIAGPANPRAPDGPARFKPSDPSRLDTTGSGVCDGYLVAHGLDPSLPEAAYGDLDLDGATTREEYLWSQGRSGTAACSIESALDPRDATSGTSTIPDGWLIRSGLDPLQAGIDALVTQDSERDPRPEGVPPVGPLQLTVLSEYQFGRPSAWSEARDGPWWGGTDPALNDTDGDGLGDAWELSGYTLTVTREPGGKPNETAATLDPTVPDSDGDGLLDVEEARLGTDGRKPDTDFDGLTDGAEIALEVGLNATKADSAGDLLRDGARYALLVNRSAAYSSPDAQYACICKEPLKVRALPQVAEALAAQPSLTVSSLFGPLGDIDRDEKSNIVDMDMDEDGLHNGLEVQPDLFAGEGATFEARTRPATDPLNPDSDGDHLRDWWEAKWGRGASSNLNPTHWDSNDNRVSDDLEDPDGDSVAQWFGVVANQVRTGSFPMNNRAEHDLGYEIGKESLLNPNNPDIDGDLLTDGFELLWMRTGGPHPPNVETPQPVGAPSSRLFPNVTYVRYVPKPLGSSALEVLRDANDPTILVEAPDPAAGGLVPLAGSFAYRFHDAQRLQTSPHSLDSDGDGAPDWWEDLYGTRLSSLRSSYLTQGKCVPNAATAPRPTVPDGGADPDGDGLTNAQEFQAGGDPLCLDTDLGGIADGQEKEVLRNVNDPTDDLAGGDGADSDSDGLADSMERIGMRYDDLGETPVKTDPLNPDSDGDGLLDGPDRPAAGVCWAVDNPVARKLLDLGMAYTKAGGATQCYTILGERGTQGSRTLDPTEPDDCRCGLPAGWQEVYGRSTSLRHYNLGRPSWWSEPDHGPWWGGAAPGGSTDIEDLESLADLDGDGLLDKDLAGDPSEDPYPAANSANEERPVAGAAHPLDLTATAEARRLGAQAFLNPRAYDGARPTVVHPLSPLQEDERAATCLEDVATVDSVKKGTAVSVTGKLVACVGKAPVPNVAVQAFVGKDGFGLFGADFTDSAGAFDIPLLVSGDSRSVAIPDAGTHSSFRGKEAGTVTWTPDSSVVGAGDAVVAVRSYAMGPLDAGTGWKRSDVWSKQVQVEADAILEVAAPDKALSGQEVPIVVRLRDSGGAPLDSVDLRVTWDHAVVPLDPARTSGGELAIDLPPVPPARAGLVPLHVTTVGGGVEAKTFDKAIQVQSLGIVSVDPVPTADAGTTVTVRGLVARSLAVGSVKSVPHVPVDVQAERDGVIVVPQVETVSGPDGRFTATLFLPANLTGGAITLAATVAESDLATGARGERPMQVRSLPVFTKVALGDLSVGRRQVVTGTLLEPNGDALGGALVGVQLGDHSATGITDENGTFSVAFNESLRPGRILQSLSFAGDAGHAPASHSAERTVTSPTRLQMSPGVVARGGDASVPATLLGEDGQPIAGAAVTLQWGAEAARSVVTDAAGVAVLVRPGAATDPLGPVLVHARYAGSPGAGLGNSTAEAVWTVRSLAAIELPSEPVEAGGAVPSGRLVDAGTGAPLAGRLLEVRLGDRLKAVTTDSRGGFPLMAPVAATSEPATLQVSVAFAGDASYPATNARGEVRLRSPTEVVALVPALLVAGQPVQVTVEVVDARGLPAAGGTLQALIGGRPAGATTVDGPTVRLTVRLPEDTPGGPGTLVLAYSGSQTHGAALQGFAAEVVAHAALVLEAEPARVGEPVTLTALLLIAGKPAPGESVHLQVEGLAEGLVGVTDKDGIASFQLQQVSEGFRVLARYAGGEAASPAASAGLLAALPEPGFFERNALVLPWVVAALALVLAGGALAAWKVGRHPLAPGLARARRILLAKGPLEQQVLQAYGAIEDVAIGAGLLLQPARTPRGLQKALAPALPAAAQPSLDTLIAVFEAARYGREPLLEAQRDAAIAALRQIGRVLPRISPGSRSAGVPA